MPYSNVPRHLWAKMDRCVEKVMRRSGVSKERAIAICHSQMVKELELEVGMGSIRQARKARQRVRREEEIKAEVADTCEDCEDVVKENGDAPVEAKDAHGPMAEVYRPFGGATSWADLDEYTSAQEQAMDVEHTTHQMRSLIENILSSDEIDNKGAAVANVAEEFEGRLADATEKAAGEDESCPCGCDENKGWLAKVVDKARVFGAARNDLPDSAFAYIESGGEKDEGGRTKPRSLRHYPIQDAAHARNALARASQAIARGGKTADIARRAMSKIRAADKKFGIEVSEEEGKDLPDASFVIVKAADGRYRWFGWVTNKWIDRDVSANPAQGGDIIEDKAHQEYITWLNANPALAPESWIWHTPGTARKHRVDWWDYAHGQVMMSGPMEIEEAERATEVYSKVPGAMSHGFFALRDQKTGNIVKYRTFEVSDLPRSFAANPWTEFRAIKEAVQMGFSDTKRQHLVGLIGEDAVKKLEQETATREKALVDLGVAYKATDQAEQAPATSASAPEGATAVPAATPAPAPAKEATPAPAAAPPPETDPVVQAVVDALGLKDLSTFLTQVKADLAAQATTLAGVQATVADLKKDDDQKLAEAIAPRVVPVDLIWKNRPSTSPENKVDGDEAKGPSVDWVQEALGIAPLQQ